MGRKDDLDVFSDEDEERRAGERRMLPTPSNAASLLGGLVCGLGWLLFLDAHLWPLYGSRAWQLASVGISGYWYLGPVVATLGLMLINAIPKYNPVGYDRGDIGWEEDGRGPMVILDIGIGMTLVGPLAQACRIAYLVYVEEVETAEDATNKGAWKGQLAKNSPYSLAVGILANLCIAASAFAYKYGRKRFVPQPE